MGEEEKAAAAAEAAEAAEGKKSLFTKKNLIILLALVVILLGVSVFIVFKVVKPLLEDDATRQIEIESIGKKDVGIIYEMEGDGFIVNVAGTGATRYLRLALAFEVEDTATQGELVKREVEVKDLILMVLGTKKMEQLDSIAARDELKREILNRLNDKLKSGNILNVFFTDFVIQ